MSSEATCSPLAIRAWLDGLGIAYRHLVHRETRTSEESAAARDEPLEIGAKALLVKTDEQFRLFVLSAACKLQSSAVKRRLGVKSTRFATADELLAQTGLVPGSVPPFGRPILPFELHVDAAITTLDRVAFNCGALTESIVMSAADYLRAAQPTATFAFAGT